MIDLEIPGLSIYRRSVVRTDGATYFLARRLDLPPDAPAPSPGWHQGKVLGIQGDFASGHPTGDGFGGQQEGSLYLCPLTPANAAALRDRFAWLRPRPLGLQRSAGCGDRLGLATPGHLRAVRSVGGIAPILAQQSMRENARTGRSPQQVLDDAMWGVFQEGWREPWGADADHLKTLEEIDLCVAAGYTFFTIDPGDYVDNSAQDAPLDALQVKVEGLPWAELNSSPQSMQDSYLGRDLSVEGLTVTFDEVALARAASKYGRALAHTARMYHHLASRTSVFELEMSVDETETATSLEEHFYIASELKRLDVAWVSLAPRYVGRFEKGVDYIGDLGRFEAEIASHAAVARVLGPYKLSIHSGSDKFSIYPLIARHAHDLVHLKTAGTSYLEALRTVAQVAPGLFRDILAHAVDRYPEDRATYHVSARLDRVPGPGALADADLPALLDQFDAREVLHVTFGSVLNRFHSPLMDALREHEEVYDARLEQHFRRHLLPFVE
jgi:tagaturonate epimerase